MNDNLFITYDSEGEYDLIIERLRELEYEFPSPRVAQYRGNSWLVIEKKRKRILFTTVDPREFSKLSKLGKIIDFPLLYSKELIDKLTKDD